MGSEGKKTQLKQNQFIIEMMRNRGFSQKTWSIECLLMEKRQFFYIKINCKIRAEMKSNHNTPSSNS